MRNQTLEIRTETPELLGALSTLSTFYDENTPAERRRLRATIERRGLHANEQFLSAAESVIQVCRALVFDQEGAALGLQAGEKACWHMGTSFVVGQWRITSLCFKRGPGDMKSGLQP